MVIWKATARIGEMGAIRNLYLLLVVICSIGYICTAKKPTRIFCSVIFDEGKKTLIIVDGQKTPYVAQAWFENQVNTTG